jgi:hypothetical protein
MFFEPYMPEVRHYREIGNPARRGDSRPVETHVGRTTRRGKPDGALPSVSRKTFRLAADRYAIIVAIAAAGVVAGFYSAMAMVRR